MGCAAWMGGFETQILVRKPEVRTTWETWAYVKE